MPRIAPPTYAVSRCLFLRGMGLVYLSAFWSLGVQITGLAGKNGILPAAPFLDAARAQLGADVYWRLPTVCWLTGASDPMLQGLCIAGCALSVLLIAGLLPLPCLAGAWALYLSLSVVTRTFLNFQWDILLIEAGFLALFMAPPAWRCRLPCRASPPRLARWLVWCLLFRLMFSSGMVKLTSGDPTWSGLRALDVHYQTQPLPPWTAWYAHQMPGWFQSCCVAIMFFIELVVPFFIWVPHALPGLGAIPGARLLRRAAFALLVAFQLLIAATGNYAFFNWLTIVLCVPLLDDDVWPTRWRPPPDSTPAPSPPLEPGPLSEAGARLSHGPLSHAPLSHAPRGRASLTRRLAFWAAAPLALLLALLGTADMTMRFRWELPWPAPLLSLGSALAPLRIVNAYGLFAVMTTERNEIVVEGSNDGQTWLPYEFKWKPGDLLHCPAFVAPHQPRLDWQMWFAALGNYRNQPWFQNFLVRLLQGSPEVLALIERNPFPGAPPRYVRSTLYEYRFTDFATRRADGAWWRREERGPYGPPVSLQK